MAVHVSRNGKAPAAGGAGQLQEQAAQGQMVLVLTGSATMDIDDVAPLALRQAATTMTSGRPGPVNLDIPFNLFQEEAEVDTEAKDRGDHGIAASREKLRERLWKMLRDRQRSGPGDNDG